MSKDILSLKFRPQTFDEFIGQPQVVYPLVNSIKNNNIHHAYLFFGPRGVGKTSAARILAKMLNCENGPVSKPCNKCNSCIEITKNISPDVIEIDGASNRGINEIRQLQENIKFAPIKSRYKIYIIDEVHMLTKEAFNALLKTLEEPPEHVVFIFATTEIHKVIPTIRSRCQQYQFKLFTIKEIKQLLIKILTYYNIKYEEKALYWIGKFANGSLRDSLSILSQIIAYNNEKITEKDTLYILGVQPITNLITLFQAIIKKDISSLYKIINNTSLSGIDPGNFAQQVVDFLRILSFINNNMTEYEILEMPQEDFDQLKQIASHFTIKQIILMIEKLAEFIKYMGVYLNPFPYLENILISFAYYEDFIYPSEIIKEIKEVKNYLEKKYIKISRTNNSNKENRDQVKKSGDSILNTKIDSNNNQNNILNNISKNNSTAAPQIDPDNKISNDVSLKTNSPIKDRFKNETAIIKPSEFSNSKTNSSSVTIANNEFEISEELKKSLQFDENILFEKNNNSDPSDNEYNYNYNGFKYKKNTDIANLHSNMINVNTISDKNESNNDKIIKDNIQIKNKLNNLKSMAKNNIHNNHNIPENYKTLIEIFDSIYIDEKE